jgi:antitoxin component of MazEF toxin-antitoxin module
MQTQLRKIGNSTGVMIAKKMLDESGIEPNAEVNIEVSGRAIIITALNHRRPLNGNLGTWRAQIRTAIKGGQKTGKSVWKNDGNKAFAKDWIW